MNKLIYPESPAGVADDVTEPSADFKKNVASVIGYLFLFAVTYIVLLLAGLALAVVLGIIGMRTIYYVHHIMAIVFGLGMVGVGVMVCYFLIKFLFANKKEDNGKRVAVTEEEYPLLFEFVRKLSIETGTQFPKHIYIIPDVNASVSYDSNIKSLIFPVRKNLSIGLGLVNMTNLSEFKAVLAHEFGHFSQESMRAGSYIYQANKVIYNMLYDNEGYGTMIDKWASIHSSFALCASATVKIVQAIQWILQQVYSSMNKAYMSLSRQMEFHADAVAARVSGSNNCIHALRRLEFADAAYNHAIGKYNAKLKEQYKAVNVYSHQRISASFIADTHKVPHILGLPDLHQMHQYIVSYRRINIEDQWASHPTREQREQALNTLGITGAVCHESPWTLFGDGAIQLQELLTGQLYEQVKFEDSPKPMDDTAFTALVQEDNDKYDFPNIYKGYYDNRKISEIKMDEIQPRKIADIHSFFEEHKDLNRKIQAVQEDINTLDYAADEKNRVRYFDLEGVKMYRSDAVTVKKSFEKQSGEMQAALAENDAAVYAHYLALASEQDETDKLKLIYSTYYDVHNWTAQQLNEAEPLLEDIRAVYQQTFTVEAAEAKCKSIVSGITSLNNRIQNAAGTLSTNILLQSETVPEDINRIDWKKYKYFEDSNFLMQDFDETWDHVIMVLQWYHELNFSAQKKLLQLQFAPEAVLQSS